MNNNGITNESLHKHILDEEIRMARMEHDLEILNQKLSNIETSVADLVSAWKTANGVVAFVKWLAGIATAGLAFIAFLKLWR